MFVRVSALLGALSEIKTVAITLAETVGKNAELSAQKAKDDVSIDWLRHRVNMLERELAVLRKEVTHLDYPAPEIQIINRNVTESPKIGAALDEFPSFEDVGDDAMERNPDQYATK